MEKIFRHPRAVAGGVALVTLFFALQLPRARMDNNIIAFLPDHIAERILAKHFEDQYGGEIMIMTGLERPYGTVFDPLFLSRIRDFGKTVETFELVKNVNSIMSTQYITADQESIIVADLVDDGFSGTPEEIAELRRRLASWDVYQGALVSRDHSATQIVVTLNAASGESGNPEVAAALAQIRDLAKEMFAGLANVYTAGQPLVSAALSESAFADIIFLVPLALAALLTVLVFSFRRWDFVLFPLLTVLAAVIWALGAMPLFHVTLTLLSMVLPVILIAVGSAYAIHLVSHYRDEADSRALTGEEHRAFVLRLLRRLAKPVFLAALTTFAGFISFCFAPLTPMRDFGVFASFGVLAAFSVAMLLVPALLIIRGPGTRKAPARKSGAGQKPRFSLNSALAKTMSAAARRKAPALALTALVILVSVIGASKVVVDNSMVEFFSEDTEVSRGDRFIREHFGGSAQLFVSVEAEDTQTLLDPAVLTAMDGLSAYLSERVPEVGKVSSFTDLVKRMNQMFNVGESPDGIPALTGPAEEPGGSFGFGDFGFEDQEGEASPPLQSPAGFSASPSAGDTPATPPASSLTAVSFALINAAAGKRPDMSAGELVRELERLANYQGYGYYEIPADPARYGKQSPEELQQLVANYLALLSGDRSQTMSNDPLEPTAVEMIILINSRWQEDVQKVIRIIQDYAAANFPETVRVLAGGGSAQEGALAVLVVNSQIISIVVSALMALLIVALSNRSLAAGLIAALPLAVAVLANFAVMGFLGITLNMATAMIASLAVGIGIDYTIHFIEAFKREHRSGGDYLYRAFAGSGKAILINALSVGAGFCVLAFSRFRIMAQFGGLVALSMAISAAVSLTVIPALLIAVKPGFIYGSAENKGVLP
ncbi:MAG: MMPL family transporter [Treponema sp.]|nr:MMPL family transporter [Treponema sp.]